MFLLFCRTGSKIKELPPLKDLSAEFDFWEPGELEMQEVPPLECNEEAEKTEGDVKDEEGSRGKGRKHKSRGRKGGKKKEEELEEEMPVDITKAWVEVKKEEKSSQPALVEGKEEGYVDITKAWVPVEREEEACDYDRAKEILADAMGKVHEAAERRLGKGRRPRKAEEIDKMCAAEDLSPFVERDNYLETRDSLLLPDVLEAAETYLRERTDRFSKKLARTEQALAGMSMEEAVRFVEAGEEIKDVGEEEELSFERRLPASGRRKKHVVRSGGDQGSLEGEEEEEEDTAPQGNTQGVLKALSSLTLSGIRPGSGIVPGLDPRVLPYPDPDEVIPGNPGEAVADLTWLEEWLRRVRANADFVRDQTFWAKMNEKMKVSRKEDSH